MKNNLKILWILTIVNTILLGVVIITFSYLAFIRYPNIEKNLRTEYRSADEAISCDFETCSSYEKKLEDFVTKENQELHDFVNTENQKLYDYVNSSR